jgi:mannose-6-phosphate isomerase
MKPFRVKAKTVARVWGGKRLDPQASEPIGEKWEIHGENELEDGSETLDQLTRRLGRSFLGEWAPDPEEGFPLLIKWLDCQDWLSIQVHPDDALVKPQHRGKAEAWFFAEVAPEAETIHGWKEAPLDRQQLENLKPADWVGHLRRFRPEQGSWSYTAPGTVHALGPGLLVYEVQQSSDITYRLYDWDRVGNRELHIAQGIDAICDSQSEPTVQAPEDLLGKLEVLCPHFTVETVDGDHSWSPQGRSFEIVTALASLQIDGHLLEEGASCLIPADAGQVRCSSQGSWLRVRLAPPR